MILQTPSLIKLANLPTCKHRSHFSLLDNDAFIKNTAICRLKTKHLWLYAVERGRDFRSYWFSSCVTLVKSFLSLSTIIQPEKWERVSSGSLLFLSITGDKPCFYYGLLSQVLERGRSFQLWTGAQQVCSLF